MLLLMVALVLVMLVAVIRREFLRCRRRCRRRFSSARGPRLEVARGGAVGLGGRRQLGAGRLQRRRVDLHVDGRETFSEDRVVRLEVNVEHRTSRDELRR